MTESLSEREIEILRLAADGQANAEIAAKLSLSLNTIKWYSKRIYEKLGVESRTQAIRRGQHLGLLSGASHQPKTEMPETGIPETGMPKTKLPRANLPSPLTTFVGRRIEVDTVKHLVKKHRLVTLTGPGGIGKTRLALQVATEISGHFKDGIYFFDLASINEADLVINSIAHVLGVTESLDVPLLTLTQMTLQDKQMLLILDNFEHLLDAAPMVAELMGAVSTLSVLITSREVLALYGEQEYVVPPMNLPDPEWFAITHPTPTPQFASEALQLFESCAQSVYADFRLTAENLSAVASICLRLDGLPLAIELAAAYIKVLSPQTILMKLNSLWLEMNRPLRNVPARHQTLRNTIEWSYRFLNAEERRLFAQLAVFRGGCTFEAINEICDHDSSLELIQLLHALVNKSLVWQRKGNDGQPRFGMLETIREYALDCLHAQGDTETLQQRHALYYTGYIYHVELGLATIQQRLLLNQLEIEIDNFRAALRWALAHDPEPGLRMIGDLASCWRIRGYLTEGMNWAQQLLALHSQVPAPIQSRAYANTALLAMTLGHSAEARQMADSAFQLAQQSTDPQTRAQALYASLYVRLLPNLVSDAYEEITALANEAERLYKEMQNRPGHARVYNLFGDVYRMQHRFQEAKRFYEESLQEIRSEGYLSDVVSTLANLGWTSIHMGQLEDALAYLLEGLELSNDLDFPFGTAICLLGIAGVWTRAGHTAQATTLASAAVALHQSLGGVMIASHETEYNATIVELRAQLNQADFERYWQAGNSLAMAEAITLARTALIPQAVVEQHMTASS